MRQFTSFLLANLSSANNCANSTVVRAHQVFDAVGAKWLSEIDRKVMSASDDKASTAVGRSCGSCALCCKLIGCIELNKPMGQWCPHCLKSSGCSIYDTRPNECRSFNCEWLTSANFGDEWQPIRSKMVICHMRESGTSKLVFHVDPGSPLSWKNEPYYRQLKRLARNGLEYNGIVTINVGKRVFVVLPQRRRFGHM